MATRVSDLRNQRRDYAALDDRMLVLDFQAGDPEAFVEIHHRYGGLARHVCRRFLSSPQDADEAFQETMIRVFQGLHRFNGRYALQPWVTRIATNVSLDQLRSAARRPSLDDGSIEDDEPRDPADGPEEAFERLIERDLVLSVMADLPEKHRAALVLREIEGRSHKEIGERLDMTPSQAKALIHRAKGSFRRGWLLAVTEKGGFAGIALLPLLWLAKVGDVARRFVDRAGHASQVAQAATPEVVTATASSPAAAVATSGIGERIVAAGMTILVAGSVTVGAVAVNKTRHRSAPPPVTASSPAPVVRPVPIEPVASPPPAEKKDEPGRETKGTEAVAASPSPEAEVAVEPTPTASPSVEPSGSPTPPPVTTPPPIPPAPPWSLAFGSSVDLGVGTFKQISSRVSGKSGENVVFSQAVVAPRFDADGIQIGRVYLEYWGGAEGDTGSVDLWLFVDTPEGRYRFDGSGGLVAVASPDDGGSVYAFSGVYAVAEQPPAPDEESESEVLALHEGTFQLELRFWADGKSLYAATLQLSEV